MLSPPARAAKSPAPPDTLAAPATLPLQLVVDSRFGAHGSGPRQMLEPRGIVVDAFGRYLIADAAMHRLVRLERDGTWVGEAGALGDQPGELRRPTGVGLTGSSSFAVLDQDNQRIVSYDLFVDRMGTLVDFNDPALVALIGRMRGVALAADRGGAIVVADAESDRLLTFDFAGRFLRQLGGYGTQPGQLRRPAGVAVSARGQLWVAERMNARVQRWDASGRPVASWSLPVTSSPGALALAVSDSVGVAVADETGGRLLLYDGAGKLLGWVGGLERPAGVTFVSPERVAVTESAAGRVTVYAIRARP